MGWRRPELVWVACAVAFDAVLAAIDVAAGSELVFTGAFVIAPLALATVAGPREVAGVAVLSIALAVASGWWNHMFADGDHIVRTTIVAIGSALAVVAASSRRMVVESRRRMELLADVGRVADEAPSPEAAVAAVGEVLVPGLADAAGVRVGERSLLDIGARDVSRRVELPLVRGGAELGTLTLGWTEGRAREADPEFARVVSGRVALVVANAELIGALTSTRERLDRTLGALAEAVTVQDEHGRTVYANEAAARLLGVASAAEVLAAEPGALAARFTVSHEDGSPVAVDDLPGARVLRGESPEPLLTQTVELATGRARWLLTKATRADDADGRPRAVNVIEDVTDAKDAERRQRFLAEAGAVLAGSLDYQQTLERVAQLSVPTLAEWCAVDVVDERGGLERVALAHSDSAKVRLGEELNRRYPPDLAADTGPGAVLRSGTPQLYAQISEEMLVAEAQDADHADKLRQIGLRSAMLVPLRAGGRTTGVLTFADGTRTFTPDDLAFAQDLALLAATAVETARAYTERRTASETLQRSLLPDRLPDVPCWRTASLYQPGAPGVEVGGDFYDVFGVPGGHMVLLGDVTGKGVQAAALTSLARYTARTAALYDSRPHAVLRLLNRVLRDQASPAFVTVVCARLEAGGLVTVAAAGHPLPLRAPAAGGAMEIGAHGILLGATADADWGENVARLLPGDTLLLYTDGVTDTAGEEERFGEARLARLVADAPRDPEQLLAAVSEALSAFQGGALLDDRAMLAVQYTGAPEEVGEAGPRLGGGVHAS